MSSEPVVAPTRRDALKATGGLAVAAGFGLSGLYAGESNTINIALVGCGGRGTGAAENALSTHQGPVKLVAMADAYKDRLNGSFNHLANSKRLKDKVAVTDDTKFIGFDAYKKAIDCLSAGDVVILATPPAFRWVHFTYAIEKGVNVFMEKPVCRGRADGQEDVRPGREVGQEEHEGRRRPHVPALPGPQRDEQADPGRGDRRPRPAAGLPAGRADREHAGPQEAGRTRTNWSTRSASSTGSCGPPAGPTATS